MSERVQQTAGPAGSAAHRGQRRRGLRRRRGQYSRVRRRRRPLPAYPAARPLRHLSGRQSGRLGRSPGLAVRKPASGRAMAPRRATGCRCGPGRPVRRGKRCRWVAGRPRGPRARIIAGAGRSRSPATAADRAGTLLVVTGADHWPPSHIAWLLSNRILFQDAPARVLLAAASDERWPAVRASLANMQAGTSSQRLDLDGPPGRLRQRKTIRQSQGEH